MSTKPIFVATHPRACSTAFERVFMTCRDTIQCIHEPFGDAFYYGPERLSDRFADDEATRIASGFSESTYKTVWDRIEREASEGKRIFIKDIIHYLFPPDGKPASIAPSLCKIKRGVGTASETVTTNGVHSQNGVADGVNGHASGVDVNGASNGFHHGGDVDTTRNGVHEAFADGKSAGNASAPYPYETEPEPGNPTVVPQDLLARFHFAFLIRDPHYSVASYYRCTIPPLVEVNGWNEFDPSEAGYNELRRMFDYLRRIHQIGPRVATRDDLIVDETADAPKKVHHANGNANGVNSTTTTGSTPYEDSGVEICVVDADDLLEKPAEMIQAFCRSVGLPYDPTMLQWSSDEDQQYAREVFEKWRGFHDDAINSSELKARQHARKVKSEEEFDAEWREKYGEEGAKVIRETVDANMADYLYLKQFAMRV